MNPAKKPATTPLPPEGGEHPDQPVSGPPTGLGGCGRCSTVGVNLGQLGAEQHDLGHVVDEEEQGHDRTSGKAPPLAIPR